MTSAIRKASITVVSTAAILLSGTTAAIAAPTTPTAPAVSQVVGEPLGATQEAAAETVAAPALANLRPEVTPVKRNWAADTAIFAGCLGGFGFVAAPIVAGFMFGGPGGAVAAAKAWIPRLGPVGGGILKWCMASVLGIRM
ncbi:hypothetical protein [Nocardia farcinica]|uniref:hypothetical protein n=1 Tax=Nocardia farcinica TaxID=37329 RepID=UPI00245687EE|nr:hypothetical protein [Nocardia farcinica]